jgi:hypothetical protein
MTKQETPNVNNKYRLDAEFRLHWTPKFSTPFGEPGVTRPECNGCRGHPIRRAKFQGSNLNVFGMREIVKTTYFTRRPCVIDLLKEIIDVVV